jgi:hypothetical protein
MDSNWYKYMKKRQTMNKENQLLLFLDEVFGFEYIRKSPFKKLKQELDQKKNEHVFISNIE